MRSLVTPLAVSFSAAALAFAGCQETPGTPTQTTTVVTPAPTAAPTPPPASPRPAAPAAEKTDDDGVRFEASSNGGSISVNEDDTNVDLKVGKDGFGLDFSKK